MRLWRYRLRNACFGTAQANFEGHGRHLYPRYLGSFFLSVAAAALIGGIFYTIVRDDIIYVAASHQLAQQSEAGATEDGGQDSPEVRAAQERISRARRRRLSCRGLLVFFAFTLYRALVVRYIAGGISLAGLRFRIDGDGRRAGRPDDRQSAAHGGHARLRLSHRPAADPGASARPTSWCTGRLDGTVIEQSRLLPPRLGEGWLEVLDPGII